MIAISYRREDSAPIAARLYDRLRAEFGRENVFMDFDSIPFGVDFRERIAEILAKTNVVVAVMGSRWVGPLDETRRRIDDENDYVRLEISEALQRQIPIIPTLINNQPMPEPEELPPAIRDLAFRNGLALDAMVDFHHHADRLIARLHELVKVKADAGASVQQAASGAKIEPLPAPELGKIAAQSSGSGGRAIFTPSRGTIWIIGIALVSLILLSGIYYGLRLVRSRPVAPSPVPAPAATPSIASNELPLTAAEAIAERENQPVAQTTPIRQSEYVPPSREPATEEVQQFVRDYYAAMSRRDVEAVVTKFAREVNYQGQGWRNREYIRRDATSYFARWEALSFNVNEINVTKTGDGDILVTFDASYTLTGPRGGKKTGVSSNIWKLKRDLQDQFRIVSQQERVR